MLFGVYEAEMIDVGIKAKHCSQKDGETVLKSSRKAR